MRIIGLDIGEKTIGVAISDALGWTAQGLETIKRTNLKKDIDSIKNLISQWDASKIVIGLPKNMDGSMGPQADKVIEFAKRLKEKTAVDIVLWDERLTTVAAERLLIEADVSRAKRKKVIDKLAATYILQGYLDRKSNMCSHESDD